MRSKSARDELQDGIDLSTDPPMLPDGGYAVPPPRKNDPPPRLCEQGPCVHYHTFAIVMDTEKPKGDAFDPRTGRVSGAAGVVADHLNHHHYCYPTVGIETDLGETPIVDCNLWVPRCSFDSAELAREEKARTDFEASEAGQQYRTALDVWLERQAAMADADQRMAEEAMRVMQAAELEREALAMRAGGIEFDTTDVAAAPIPSDSDSVPTHVPVEVSSTAVNSPWCQTCQRPRNPVDAPLVNFGVEIIGHGEWCDQCGSTSYTSEECARQDREVAVALVARGDNTSEETSFIHKVLGPQPHNDKDETP